MGKAYRGERDEKAYTVQKISQKMENRSCKAQIAVLQYVASITFPKASGKAGYIGKLPCGGFSKDCELEKANCLCRAYGNIIQIGAVPPEIQSALLFCAFSENKMFKLSFSLSLGWRAIMTSFQGERKKKFRQSRGETSGIYNDEGGHI